MLVARRAAESWGVLAGLVQPQSTAVDARERRIMFRVGDALPTDFPIKPGGLATPQADAVAHCIAAAAGAPVVPSSFGPVCAGGSTRGRASVLRRGRRQRHHSADVPAPAPAAGHEGRRPLPVPYLGEAAVAYLGEAAVGAPEGGFEDVEIAVRETSVAASPTGPRTTA